MAAPRKYSDVQRHEMYRLYEATKNPAEIARLCEQGTAGVAPFQVPRRTVHEIVTNMAAEAEQELPKTIDDATSAEAVERFPVRIAAIADAEIERLAMKQERSGLSPDDLDRLRKVSDLSAALRKRLHRPPAAPAKQKRRTRKLEREESALERLVREEGERPGEKVELVGTRAPPPPLEPAPEKAKVVTTPDPPPETPLDAVRRVAAKHGIDIGEMEWPPVSRSREAARHRARAALSETAV